MFPVVSSAGEIFLLFCLLCSYFGVSSYAQIASLTLSLTVISLLHWRHWDLHHTSRYLLTSSRKHKTHVLNVQTIRAGRKGLPWEVHFHSVDAQKTQHCPHIVHCCSTLETPLKSRFLSVLQNFILPSLFVLYSYGEEKRGICWGNSADHRYVPL